MIIITSISPTHKNFKIQQDAVDSYIKLGLKVYSFNTKDELKLLKSKFLNVIFKEVDNINTGLELFNKPYININYLIEKGFELDDNIFILNSDIILDYNIKILNKIKEYTNNGLVIGIRYNIGENIELEKYGIDGFALNIKFKDIFKDSIYCMGQSWWDYDLPYTFIDNNIIVYRIDSYFLIHNEHKQQWKTKDWITLSNYFKLTHNILTKDPAIIAMDIRNEINNKSIKFDYNMNIYERLNILIGNNKNNTIIEIGANIGQDTKQLLKYRSIVHAFEPDPRNEINIQSNNLIVNKLAISNKIGQEQFYLSNRKQSRWTESSSIKTPINHLIKYPYIDFDKVIEVDSITLDKYTNQKDIKHIDFIWCDIQGAEKEMILGAKTSLSFTKYLYIEYSNEELYEDQPNLTTLISLLPGKWNIIEDYGTDILLENITYNPIISKIIKQPKTLNNLITILTVCSRPENLDNIYNSIISQNYDNFKWIVSFDSDEIPNCPKEDKRILYVKYKNGSSDVTNYAALNNIFDNYIDEEIYFHIIDDDNILFPNYFNSINNIINSRDNIKFIVYNQEFKDNKLRFIAKTNNIRQGFIDIAQVCFHSDLIENTRFIQNYTADGIFYQQLFNKIKSEKSKWEWVNKTFCYYNYLNNSENKIKTI